MNHYDYMDAFTKSQMDRADRANAALCIALEMVAYLYHQWETGTPCFEVTDESLHDDAPIGNAVQLGDEADSIRLVLDQFFPRSPSRVDPALWDDRIEALLDAAEDRADLGSDALAAERSRAERAEAEVARLKDQIVRAIKHARKEEADRILRVALVGGTWHG